MARLIQGIAVPAPNVRPADPLADLTRLLSRLQQTILRADAERERRLRTSEFERRKAQTNIQYAQSLLHKIEHEAATNKLLPRRPEWQADLSRKREMIEQLTERMHDLEEIGGSEEDADSTDGEDILSDIIATPSESMDSRSADAPLDDSRNNIETDDREAILDTPEPAAPPPPPVHDEKPRELRPSLSEKAQAAVATPPAATVTSNTLRPRHSDPEKTAEREKDTAKSTSSALFGDRSDTSLSKTTMTEAILDTQRAEQDFLSESILKMARDLKDSSHAFASSLELDKDIVNSAGKGLDKNETGLETAARRMGTLRKMTEGKGWWGRMMLYAWIYGLMVALILVVFVLPKLRF